MSDEAPASPATAGAGVLGVGAAACVACCAGPILGALGAIGLASAAGYLVAGSAALVVGVLAAVLVVTRRRSRANGCAVPTDTPAFVAAPRLKPPAESPERETAAVATVIE